MAMLAFLGWISLFQTPQRVQVDVWLPDPTPRPPVSAHWAALSKSGTLALSDGRSLFVLRRGDGVWTKVPGPVVPAGRSGPASRVRGLLFCQGRLFLARTQGLEIWTGSGDLMVAGPRDAKSLLGLARAGRRLVAWSHRAIWVSGDCGGRWVAHHLPPGSSVLAAAAFGSRLFWLTRKGIFVMGPNRERKCLMRYSGLSTLVVAGMTSGPVLVVAGGGVIRILRLRDGRHLRRLVVPGRRLVADPNGGFWVVGSGLVRVLPSGAVLRGDFGLPQGAVLAPARREVLAFGRQGLYRREHLTLGRRIHRAPACARAWEERRQKGWDHRIALSGFLPRLSMQASVSSPGARRSRGRIWWILGTATWRPSLGRGLDASRARIRIRNMQRLAGRRVRLAVAYCRRWRVLLERNLASEPHVSLALRLGFEAQAALLDGMEALRRGQWMEDDR